MLRNVGEKSMGEVPSIDTSQPFVPTVANSAITECKFLDIGKKKKKKGKKQSKSHHPQDPFQVLILQDFLHSQSFAFTPPPTLLEFTTIILPSQKLP